VCSKDAVLTGRGGIFPSRRLPLVIHGGAHHEAVDVVVDVDEEVTGCPSETSE
jgi:coenzyme F420-reducing hydrogenase gamma subunit